MPMMLQHLRACHPILALSKLKNAACPAQGNRIASKWFSSTMEKSLLLRAATEYGCKRAIQHTKSTLQPKQPLRPTQSVELLRKGEVIQAMPVIVNGCSSNLFVPDPAVKMFSFQYLTTFHPASGEA
jgi:hypothetical protein